jgi:hypothetical protein
MTSSRLLKAFALLSLLCASAAVWTWHVTGEPPDRWLVRIAATSFFVALVLGIVNPDTRPRIMLRFLAALFALFALMAFATDISSPSVEGQSQTAVSLLKHLQTFAPSFVTALERFIGRSISPVVWDPVLTSVLSLPASMIFLILALMAGFLGRPRRRVRIFTNDY